MCIDRNNCNICYEYYDDFDNIIVLTCCNDSKMICLDCISCLTTYICPYCRNILSDDICDIIHKNNIKKLNNNQDCLSFSAPNTSISHINDNNLLNTFLCNDYLIDPFADYYHNRDTRVLRRRMRQLRKQLLNKSYCRTQTLHHINNYNTNNLNNEKSNNRKIMKNYTNKITKHLQQNHNNLSEENYSDIQEDIFKFDN